MMNIKYVKELRIIKDYFGLYYQLQQAVPIEAGKGWNTVFSGSLDECKTIGRAYQELGCTVEVSE